MATAANADSPWLFPGRGPGQPLNSQYLMSQLRHSGIHLLGARNSALRQLVLDMPPAVAAQALGYSAQVTEEHARHAGKTWVTYASYRHTSARQNTTDPSCTTEPLDRPPALGLTSAASYPRTQPATHHGQTLIRTAIRNSPIRNGASRVGQCGRLRVGGGAVHPLGYPHSVVQSFVEAPAPQQSSMNIVCYGKRVDLNAIAELIADVRADVDASLGVSTSTKLKRIRRFLQDPGVRAVAYLRAQLAATDNGHVVVASTIRRHNLSVHGLDAVEGVIVGKRLIIRHPVGIVLGAGSRIGDDVTILQGVTLGQKRVRLGDDWGCPNGVKLALLS